MRLRSAFADLPLQRKLLILVGVAALIALFTATAVIVGYEFTTYRPRATEVAREQVQSFAATVTAAVEFQDEATATAYLQAFGRQRDVLALTIMLDGESFAEYVRPGAQPIDVRGTVQSTPNSVVVRHPIDTVSGSASLWMRAAIRPFAERMMGYVTFLGAAVLSLMALTIMLSLMIRRAISEPVHALVSAAHEVTERQDYSRRVPTPRNDEIGQLARAFNAMLAAVEQRDHALRSSEETARSQFAEIEAIYTTAHVGLGVIDRDFRYVRVNSRLADLSGHTVDELIGRTISDVVPQIAPAVMAVCQQVFATGKPVVDVEISMGEGTPHARYWLGAHHPLHSQSGEIVGVNIVVVDITERKRAEHDRLKLEAQLRQSQKMEALGTLAGGIAHDFNNVLTAIAGNAQLALEDLPPAHPAMVSLREISRGTERARDLVRRILAFSRPEQNVQHLIDLRPIVDEVLRLLRATTSKMIEIRLDAAAELPTVRADASQVHQVLMNLATNACDAMKTHGGTLTVRLRDVRTDSRLRALSSELPPGRYLRVSVEDTGTGIDPELIERVFEPFFTTKPPGEGTGLGLSVVHGIMRGHEGAILVRSKPGEGTVFDLYFPAAAEASAVAELPVDATARAAGTGEHILYVDDEEQLVFLVSRMMSRMGYRVTGMTHAAEALNALRAEPERFDLLITDLGTPGMSGMELAAEVLGIRPDLPIIITSGYVRDEDVQQAECIGVRDIVLKPGTVAEMSELIRERLNELRAGRATPIRPG